MTGEEWQKSVRTLLRFGYGAEDIALRLRCGADDVRNEVAILREEGRLTEIYFNMRQRMRREKRGQG